MIALSLGKYNKETGGQEAVKQGTLRLARKEPLRAASHRCSNTAKPNYPLHYNYSVPPLLKTPNFGMSDLGAHLS